MEPLFIRPEARCRRGEPLPAEADLLLACLRSEAFAEDLPEGAAAPVFAAACGPTAGRLGLVRAVTCFIVTRFSLAPAWRALACTRPRRVHLRAG
jgi:hypothetical protein